MFSKKRFGVPVFYSTDALLKHVTKNTGMSYNDEHYGESQISYDGELIPLADGQLRYKKDEARNRMYNWAEEKIDEPQMTWDDVENKLNGQSI